MPRTYLKIEKPHSIGHRSRETQSRERDISKDSAVCSWLWPEIKAALSSQIDFEIGSSYCRDVRAAGV